MANLFRLPSGGAIKDMGIYVDPVASTKLIDFKIAFNKVVDASEVIIPFLEESGQTEIVAIINKMSEEKQQINAVIDQMLIMIGDNRLTFAELVEFVQVMIGGEASRA